jgi:dihydrofolate reductase
MGGKTWDSVPEKQRPLPGRWSIVISRGEVALAGDAVVARSLDDALAQASLAGDIDQIFVVGGAEIYRQAFEHVRCRDVWLTRIDGTFESDAHIPDISEHFVRLDDETRAVNEGGYDYRIERWRRRGLA